VSSNHKIDSLELNIYLKVTRYQRQKAKSPLKLYTFNVWCCHTRDKYHDALLCCFYLYTSGLTPRKSSKIGNHDARVCNGSSETVHAIVASALTIYYVEKEIMWLRTWKGLDQGAHPPKGSFKLVLDIYKGNLPPLKAFHSIIIIRHPTKKSNSRSKAIPRSSPK